MRKRGRAAGAAALALLNAAAWVGILFAAVGNSHLTRTHGERVAAVVFFLLVVVASVAFAARLARVGVRIGADGVVVKGPMRTWRLALSDIIRVEAAVQRGAGNGTPCPVLIRRKGRPVGVWALGKEGVVLRYRRYLEDLQPLCEELDQLLQKMRDAGARS